MTPSRPTLDQVMGGAMQRQVATTLAVAALCVLLARCSAGREVQLDVQFQPGTSAQAASSVLHHCGRSSTVWRIDTPFANSAGGLTGGIFTHSGSVTDPAIKALLTCLNRSSSVASVRKNLLSLRHPASGN